MDNNTKEKIARIEIRIKPQAKERIEKLAAKCGLSVSEYITQRALGYEPKAVPPDALFILLEKIGELEDKAKSDETDMEILKILNEITSVLLFPGKEKMRLWQLQDSGQ